MPPSTRVGLLVETFAPICGVHHIHVFGCYQFPSTSGLPWVALSVPAAFAFADALNETRAGYPDALVKPYPSPLLRHSINKVFFPHTSLLRYGELREVGKKAVLRILDGAIREAVAEASFEAPVAEVYKGVNSRVRHFFGT